jgi:hypothetical protein
MIENVNQFLGTVAETEARQDRPPFGPHDLERAPRGVQTTRVEAARSLASQSTRPEVRLRVKAAKVPAARKTVARKTTRRSTRRAA